MVIFKCLLLVKSMIKMDDCQLAGTISAIELLLLLLVSLNPLHLLFNHSGRLCHEYITIAA